jgi:hypothetical protein
MNLADQVRRLRKYVRFDSPWFVGARMAFSNLCVRYRTERVEPMT